MGHYVGARYVPKFANPLEWAENTAYEAMTVVSYNNNSYTSKIPVPPTVGNPADNPKYWALTGNYNAQVEQYRQETENYNAQVEQYRQETETEITNRKTADAALQTQINQIIAPSGEAPSAAEVQNARIGSDGTVYPTLGDAIRTQNSLLKSQLTTDVNLIINGGSRVYDATNLTWVDGGFNSGTGQINHNNYAVRTDKLTFVDDVLTVSDTTSNAGWRLYIGKYDSNGYVGFDTIKNSNFPAEITINHNYSYIFMYLDSANVARASADTLSFVGDSFAIQYVPDTVIEYVKKNAIPIYDKNTLGWVDGGINASTGVDNSNAYSVKTGKIDLPNTKITVYDTVKNKIWRLYCVYYSKSNGTYVGNWSVTNELLPYSFTPDSQYLYRFMYADTSSTSRANADTLILATSRVEERLSIEADDIINQVDGVHASVSLSNLSWVPGRINSSGENYTGAGYAYRTNDYYEFENEIVTVQDANANHANYTLTLYGYDKETSAFITGVVWPYPDVANEKIRVNTEYKYRFMYVDTTSTEMPDYTKLSLDYGYTSNCFVSVNKNLESLSDADPFRVKNAIRKPRITFIDDDGHIQFYRLIYPLMVQKGVPYCVAYMANEYPYYPGNLHMTYAQCQDVVDAGGEILGHGTTDLTTLPIQAAEADVSNTKKILEQYGFDVKGYVYPSGGSNPDVREMVAKHYAYGMKTNEAQQVYRVNTNCVPSYYINRCNNGGYYDAQTGDYANVDTASLDYMKSVIDECVSQNGWLIFVSHAAYMPEGSRRPGYENVDQVQLLSDTIDYILSLKNGGTDIDIVTASEAFAMFGNAYEAGDYLGYWNESQNYHTVPGCAISKDGKWDFPDSQRITHS